MLKSKVKVGRGITNPLFTPERVADMATAKHLKNLGIIIPAKVSTAPTFTADEMLRSRLIQQGIIKAVHDPDLAPFTDAEADRLYEEHLLTIERDYLA